MKDLLGLAAKNAAGGGGGGGNRIPKYTEAFVSQEKRNTRSTNHVEVVEMVVASSTVVPTKIKQINFFFSRIERERTVLYWGGAETVTGVPNSGTSFEILSLHRLTLAVAGADDDGSAKRMRRRSKNKNDQHDSRSKQRNVPFD